jgi:hypothetical protein
MGPEKKCPEHKITLLTDSHDFNITVLFRNSLDYFSLILLFSVLFPEPVPTP